ncbi:hypothetical protein TRVA0_021S00540 [Trichomonascus vanleenenianus]|uniref:uncharacterized protein n=1 Tax=Trichomonascus vanleenenianus TaxID=2268995 RepID=UPI003ECA3C13
MKLWTVVVSIMALVAQATMAPDFYLQVVSSNPDYNNTFIVAGGSGNGGNYYTWAAHSPKEWFRLDDKWRLFYKKNNCPTGYGVFVECDDFPRVAVQTCASQSGYAISDCYLCLNGRQTWYLCKRIVPGGIGSPLLAYFSDPHSQDTHDCERVRLKVVY